MQLAIASALPRNISAQLTIEAFAIVTLPFYDEQGKTELLWGNICRYKADNLSSAALVKATLYYVCIFSKTLSPDS